MKILIGWICFLSLLLPYHLPLGAMIPYDASTDASLPNNMDTYIIQALSQSEPSIDLSSYHMDISTAVDVYAAILQNHPEFFYVSKQISYTYLYDGSIQEIRPSYHLKDEALQMARKAYDVWIEDFISHAEDIKENFTPLEKVIYIHDYLATRYTYSPSGGEIYDVYGLITQGHGVCQALASGMIALGVAWGLEIDMVVSKEMDHAWNHVAINGQYYHIDVTRNLPTQDTPLTHEKFLLSDEGIEALGYVGYHCVNGHSCESHHFEELNEGNGYQSCLAAYQGKWLCLGNGWLARHERDGIKFLSLAEDGTWYDAGFDMNQDGKSSLQDLVIFHHVCQNHNDMTREFQSAMRKFLLSSLYASQQTEGDLPYDRQVTLISFICF